MRRVLMAVAATFLTLALAHPASATTADWVTDQAGDANLLNGQQLLGGDLACLGATCVSLPADPTGAGEVTDPLSYGPADLRALRFETTYDAIPVGLDGIHYQATGLKITVVTNSTPSSDGPTIIYRVDANIGEACSSFIQAFVRGPSSLNGDPANLAIQWRQLDATCPDGVKTMTMPFTATIDSAQKAIVMNFQYSQLSAVERDALVQGVGLFTPDASTRTNFGVAVAVPGVASANPGATAPQIDQTVVGATWTIGQDVPADVPCTLGCP